MLLLKKRVPEEVIQDRVSKLRYYVPTRWLSRFVALTSLFFIRRYRRSCSGSQYSLFENYELLSKCSENSCRVQYQASKDSVRGTTAESDQECILSQDPWITWELHKTLLIMAGEMSKNELELFSDFNGNSLSATKEGHMELAHASIASIARAKFSSTTCARYNCRKAITIRLYKSLQSPPLICISVIFENK